VSRNAPWFRIISSYVGSGGLTRPAALCKHGTEVIETLEPTTTRYRFAAAETAAYVISFALLPVSRFHARKRAA
jgi:hypothetical protein